MTQVTSISDIYILLRRKKEEKDQESSANEIFLSFGHLLTQQCEIIEIRKLELLGCCGWGE